MTIAPSSLVSTVPLPGVTLPDLTTPPSGFDPVVFDGMTVNFKMAYLARYGTGTPKEVTMGADAETQRVFREVLGFSGVTGVAIRPAGYHRPPGELTSAVFTAWPDKDQLDYMKKWAADGTIVLSGGERMRFAVNGNTLFREPPGFSTPPGYVPQSQFEAWPYEARLSYVVKQASPNVADTGKNGVTLKVTDTGDVPIYYLKGSSSADYVLMKRPERFKAISGAQATMQQFRGPGWTDEDRETYIRIKGTTAGPYKFLTFGKDSTAETAILENGRIYYAPAAFTSQNNSEINLTATLFESWSPTVQKAYIEKNKGDSGFFQIPGYVKIPLTNKAAEPYRLYYIETRFGGRDVKARPASFDKQPANLDVKTFSTGPSGDLLQTDTSDDIWSNQDRIDYLILKGTGAMLTLGGTTITTDLATGTKVYYLNSMSKADYAKMSAADQERVIAAAKNNPVLGNYLSSIGLNYPKDGNNTGDAALVDAALTELRSKLAYVNHSTDPVEVTTVEPNGTIRKLYHHIEDAGAISVPLDGPDKIEAERLIFEQQLELLKTQVTGKGLTDSQAISDKINAIKERARRWVAFFPIQADGQTWGSGSNFPYRVQSATSSGAQLQEARQRLLKSEAEDYKYQSERWDIANSNLFNGKSLDAPTIVFLFQQRYEQEVSRNTAANTEELNQINDLLKTYATIQKEVNTVLGQFTTGKPDELHGFGWSLWTGSSDVGSPRLRAISMFSTAAGVRAGFPDKVWNHPIANLHLNGQKDLFDIVISDVESSKKPQSFWSNMATSLNSTVTTLNQVAQTKMNDINSVDKQKNRHFDLANGALSKLSEMLQTLGRNIA